MDSIGRLSVVGLSAAALLLMGAPAGAVPQRCAKRSPGAVAPSKPTPSTERTGGRTSDPGGGRTVGGNVGSPAAPPPTLLTTYMAVPRSVASRTELQIDWSYPMYSTDGNRAGTRSISVEAKRALPLDEVFAYIAGEDPRPILVLRECVTCSGTDDALLTRQSDNEKTMLMSRWFHCIKISPSVLETDHEFNELFPGETPAHLFVARPDGSSRIDLNGAQSRTELWKVMGTLLDSVYSEKPDKALKRLYRVLDGFDAIDQRIVALQSDFEAAVEAGGLSSSKAKKIKKKLTKLHQEFSDLRAEASEVSKLKLRKKKA